MIIFDASYLVIYLNENPPPAKDREGNPVPQFKERVEYLAAELNASGEQIGIPAPAMAEVLVRAGRGRSKMVSILSDRWRFQILSFDARAAIEASELIALIKSNNERWDTHAKVKFDVQIVATAKAEAASVIYADDKFIENLGKRLKIPVIRICDLPLPPPKVALPIEVGPIEPQTTLFDLAPPLIQAANQTALGPKSDDPKPGKAVERPIEPDDKLQANPAHPAPIRGSDKEGAEGVAAGEEANPEPEEPPVKLGTTPEKPKAANEGGLGGSGS